MHRALSLRRPAWLTNCRRGSAAAAAGYERVRARLEVLGGTPCPRYHADHVAVRMLVTYAGPGTWYVENR